MNTNRNGLAAPKAAEHDPASASGAVAAPVAASETPTIPFDAARYWSYLDGIAASDAEKTALLEALWEIMSRFAEIGFGVDPVQTVIPALVHAALEDEGEGEAAARYAFETVAGPRYNNKKENGDDR